MTTMKEATVDPEGNVKIIDSPIPKPGPGEILIKVVISGTNPKDWKYPHWVTKTFNSGDDIAGTVTDLGPNVHSGVHKGDRVAAFHVMTTPHGSFAEYAIAPQHTVFPIPDSLSFEEASTMPLAAYTAVVALFRQLEFPSPWDSAAMDPEKPPRPVVIYGASTAIGAFAMKLARQANIHPVIAVGSKNSDFVKPLLQNDKGDRFVDYTDFKSNDDLTDGIKRAVKESLGSLGSKDIRTFDVFDCVSSTDTSKLLGNVMAGTPDDRGRKPRLTVVLPGADYSAVNQSVDVRITHVGTVTNDDENDKLLGLIWGRVFSRGLAEGWLTPHPHEVLKGGLGGLEGGLKGLRDGTVRAKKVVIRISDTEGVKQ